MGAELGGDPKPVLPGLTGKAGRDWFAADCMAHHSLGQSPRYFGNIRLKSENVWVRIGNSPKRQGTWSRKRLRNLPCQLIMGTFAETGWSVALQVRDEASFGEEVRLPVGVAARSDRSIACLDLVPWFVGGPRLQWATSLSPGRSSFRRRHSAQGRARAAKPDRHFICCHPHRPGVVRNWWRLHLGEEPRPCRSLCGR